MLKTLILAFIFCMVDCQASAGDQSHITFAVTQVGGLVVQGEIPGFSASLCFDERNLPGTTAVLTLDMRSATTAVPERDEILAAPEWLGITNHPEATFNLIAFQRMGPNTYQADGLLEIKGVKRDISFPVYLDLIEEKAEGELTLDRRDFNIGEGRWGESEKWVGYEIRISFVFFASQKGLTCD